MGVPVQSIRSRFLEIRPRRVAHFAVGLVALSSQLSLAGLAVVPTMSLRSQSTSTVTCSRTAQLARVCATTAGGLQLMLPDGAQLCPSSGEAAACASEASTGVSTGTASTPDGMTACPGDGTSAITSTLAACNDTQPSTGGSPVDPPSVTPSVPISSLQPAAANTKLSLSASQTSLQADGKMVLVATAGAAISAVGVAIEIFDVTTGALVGACAHGTQCMVAYTAAAGMHDFVAYLTAPTAAAPTGPTVVASNRVSVGWIGLSFAAGTSVVGPGKNVTVTATSSIPVERFGYALEMFDLSDMTRITYCSQGTTCTVSFTQQSSGTRSVVAAVGKPTPNWSAADIRGVSDHLSMTWLSVSMAGTAAFQVGSVIHLNATANADLTNTPWSLGLFDDQGRLVGKPCKTGVSCSADVSAVPGETPHFFAAVGAEPARSSNKLGDLVSKVTGPTTLANIQARSAPVQPIRILWGVDSCKAFTGDPTGEVYPGVASQLGAPDFWGRYLTSTVCPGISWDEIYMAQRLHMGILPIYNEYDCSNVVGYDTGMGYAQAATAAAAHIDIPQGRVVAIDIEPPGDACPGAANIDSGFIQGWYDGVQAAGYVPVFYGNGTAGSEFATAWCAAQSQNNQISRDSYVWSFEPSLVSQQWSKANAPEWQPQETGCPDFVAAWQYQIGSNSPNPNIDGDEALSTLPLWYP
jgi:hypothetical protein